ncbi:MAG TPA: sulfotransferase domain-containing protein [Sumerlaeia bacterium]|nr:sulfotransferase domain-containing protein [Sumerlaeia bacterium]
MPGIVREFIRKRKYGEPVVVVSGLPRSGTSMMMQMLAAGGLEIAADEIRTADADNPRGYCELERVKDLDKGGDKSWVSDLKGKAVKIISFLLKDLPEDCFYRVILMERDMDEMLASQGRMLAHRGDSTNASDEESKKDRAAYEKHLKKAKYLLETHPNYEYIAVCYRAALDDPRNVAERIRRFLGRKLDVERMARVPDASLYRNRR